jgi:FkbM family methyltransferase
MMALAKIRKAYPLFNVLRLMRMARPLSLKHSIQFYSAPLLWLLHMGRRSYWELLPRGHIVVGSRYGLFVARAPGITSLFQESYEVDRLLSRVLSPGSTLVDVGAHVGFYTVWACRRARLVVAIEPNPVALAYLRLNIELNNCSNVVIVPKAVSDKRGLVELRIPRRGWKLAPMNSSIIWDYEDAIRLQVEADTLDNILGELNIEEVDLLKVDVEGAEGLVVRGAGETLKRTRALLVEIWPENMWILDHLRSLGFKLKSIVDHGRYRNYFLTRGGVA